METPYLRAEKFLDYILYGWYAGAKDPVTSQWFFMKSPIPMMTLIVGYLLMVAFKRRLAPKAPVDGKYFAVAYNSFLVALSAYMFFGILYQVHILQYSFFCNDYDLSPRTTGVLL